MPLEFHPALCPLAPPFLPCPPGGGVGGRWEAGSRFRIPKTPRCLPRTWGGGRRGWGRASSVPTSLSVRARPPPPANPGRLRFPTPAPPRHLRNAIAAAGAAGPDPLSPPVSSAGRTACPSGAGGSCPFSAFRARPGQDPGVPLGLPSGDLFSVPSLAASPSPSPASGDTVFMPVSLGPARRGGLFLREVAFLGSGSSDGWV